MSLLQQGLKEPRGGKGSMDQEQNDKFGDYNQREANSVQKASRTSR